MESWEREELQKTQLKLNAISPTFCMAKWLQVTVHLQTGHTHSCHHPPTHAIPTSELESNPSALHNTAYKKEQRRLMLNGKRPDECQYCWAIEDTDPSLLSDRTIKSYEPWARGSWEDAKTWTGQENVAPTYLEVAFSSVCNFRCSYCSPHSSTRWLDEIQKYGPYPTSTEFNDLGYLHKIGRVPTLDPDNNTHLAAWRKWWPEIRAQLKVFRITGGEPLLSQETFRILEEIETHPLPQLDLAINSNLGVSDPTIDRFIDVARNIFKRNSVKRFEIYTSIDAWGSQAEYIRNGLSLERFRRNIRKILSELPSTRIVVMCTFNALSPWNFMPLLEEVMDLKQEFASNDRPFTLNPILLDTSVLHWPSHQSLLTVAEWVRPQMEDIEEYVLSRPGFSPDRRVPGFTNLEREKVRRLKAWSCETGSNFDVSRNRRDLALFLLEHDRRRGTDSKTTFPDLWQRLSAYV